MDVLELRDRTKTEHEHEEERRQSCQSEPSVRGEKRWLGFGGRGEGVAFPCVIETEGRSCLEEPSCGAGSPGGVRPLGFVFLSGAVLPTVEGVRQRARGNLGTFQWRQVSGRKSYTWQSGERGHAPIAAAIAGSLRALQSVPV